MNSIKGLNGIAGKKLAIRLDNWVLDLTFLPFFIAVLLIPSISLESDSLGSLTVFSYWVIEKILAWGSCLLIWWVSGYFISRNGKRNISIFWIWLIGFLGGIFGCTVGEICKNVLGLSFRLEFLQRTIFTSITCIGVVMITSVLGRGRRSYIFFKNEVQRSIIRERISEIRKGQVYSERLSTFQEEIANKLNTVIDLESSHNNLKNLRRELRFFSHELFKGLKHHKIRQPKNNKFFYSDFSYKLFALSLRNEPLNPNIFAMVLAFFITIPLVRLETSLKSLTASFIALLITLIIHNLQYYYWKFKSPVHLGLLFAFDFFNLLLLIIVFSFLTYKLGFYKSVSNVPFLCVMLVILYLFLYILGHVSRISDIAKINQEAARQDELNESPSLSELMEEEEYRIRLQWSKFIHSVLQPYLLVIELSSNPPDLNSQVVELKSKVRNFKESLVFFGDPEVITLDDCFLSLSKKWNGVISIISDTESIPKNTKISPQAILDLRDVTSELAINAVKHGGADTLRIEVKRRESNSLVVRAENNGVPVSKTKPGLGLAIFDLLCGNNWSLKNYGGMVIFTGRIYNQ